MTTTAAIPFMSVEEYLNTENASVIKHEYLDGEVFSMAGASDAHVTIAGNVFSLIRTHLRGSDCRAYIADMRLRVEATNCFFYPDVFVTCTAADAQQPYIKQQPLVIIEVLSPSTDAYDRGVKFAHYRQLENLLEYVLIDSQRQLIDLFQRQTAGWLFQSFTAGATLHLSSIDWRAAVEAIYEAVNFTADMTPIDEFQWS